MTCEYLRVDEMEKSSKGKIVIRLIKKCNNYTFLKLYAFYCGQLFWGGGNIVWQTSSMFRQLISTLFLSHNVAPISPRGMLNTFLTSLVADVASYSVR